MFPEISLQLLVCVRLEGGVASPSYSSFQAESDPGLLLGHREKVVRQETAICEVIGAVKPEMKST